MPSMRVSVRAVLSLSALALASSIAVQAQRGPGPGPGGGGGPQPIAGLTVAERQAFDAGARAFARIYDVAEGLGPVFNDDSCTACHRGGGGSNRRVTRIARVVDGVIDPLASLGGSLLQDRGIGAVNTPDGAWTFNGEDVPAEATLVVRRKSQPLFGLGLVDAVADETFDAIADAQAASSPEVAGRVARVVDGVTGEVVVGRFGWKAQVPSLQRFSSDALLNEMGITNPDARDEVCPQGTCAALRFNPTPALNDDGRDVDTIADFMRLLAPPGRGATSDQTTRGEQLFASIGCATCHQPRLTTGAHAVRALDHVTFEPWSDFLLHDMGPLADGLAQGAAGPTEMRTAPLWGLRNETRYLHDGSAATLEQAIERHGGQGRAARLRFDALTADARDALLAFLGSL